MLPRLLPLSRGGVAVLQLQRLRVVSPPRAPILGIPSARIVGGDNAIGRLSISPTQVRYGGSDSKKGKRPRRKDLGRGEGSGEKAGGKKGLEAKRADGGSKKDKKEKEKEQGQEQGQGQEGEAVVNDEPGTVQNVAGPKESNVGAGDDAKVAQPEVVKVVPENEIAPREVEEPIVQPYTGPIDFYKLIASTSIPYANPLHLGRPAVPPPPKGVSPPPPATPATPPSPSSSTSTSTPPPQITETHTSHSTPTAFPTSTAAPNPQPITFASTRLNTAIPIPSRKKPPSPKDTAGDVRKGRVKVPPKPEEPDNCCMSGCVNCVWDLYRESLEYYTTQKLLAQQAHAQQQQPPPPLSTPTTTTSTTPPRTNLATTDAARSVISEREWLDNEDIPVGIRVFMATEKRLRERRRERESSAQ